MLRDGFDVLVGIGASAEGFANRKHVVGEIRLFNRGVWPNRLHQLLLRQQTAWVGGENREQVERLGIERNGVTVLQHQPFGGDEGDGAEPEARG